ncbi:MAG: hypothetical protein LBC97_03385 [Bifidobacteriaceae bacterium]|jgi:hypothetical protein|nr:hypothetical protein [Bifidobacteriaceae bacterium]
MVLLNATAVTFDGILHDLMRLGATPGNRITTVAEVLGGPAAPAIVPHNATVTIIGLPDDGAQALAAALGRALGRPVSVASLVLEDSQTVVPVDLGPLQSVAFPPPPSWRDTATPGAQDDLDELLDASLQLGTRLLEKNGMVIPFAFIITAEGKTEGVDVYEDYPDVNAKLAGLREVLRANRDSYRAAAITAEMTVDGRDVLGVTLEHSEGIQLQAYLPFKKSPLRGKYSYGDLFATKADPGIWA